MKPLNPLFKILILLITVSSYAQAFYDTGQGRWVSRDPIEEQGGVNLYGFVGNAGTTKVDSLGMHPYKCCLQSLTINHVRVTSNAIEASHAFTIEAIFEQKGTIKELASGETVCCDPARCQTKQEVYGFQSLGLLHFKETATGSALHPIPQTYNPSNFHYEDDGYDNAMYDRLTDRGSDLDPSETRYFSNDIPGIHELAGSDSITIGSRFRFTVSDTDGTIVGRRHYSVFIYGWPNNRTFKWGDFNNGSGSKVFNGDTLIGSENLLGGVAGGLKEGGNFDLGPN